MAVAGAAGAALRAWITSRFGQVPGDRAVPVATLAINVSGALLLGLLVGMASASDDPLLLVGGVGFCGGFTTFSAANAETFALLRSGESKRAFAYAAGSLLGTVVGAAIGLTIT